MDVKPYSQESSKKVQIEEMFDNIAPSYDLLNRVLSLGIDRSWRTKAIRELSGANVTTLLDVATGTADLAIEAHKQLNIPHIIGVDISNKMLDVGREKLAKMDLENTIVLQQADSENLPFDDAHFDAATVAFGVRNFENLQLGVNEIYRVLKPGAKAVVLEFTKPTGFPFKQGFNAYFKYLLPVIGKIKSKDPKAYQYLYESVQAFPDYDRFLEVMRKAGFKESKWSKLSLGICAIYTGVK